MCDIDTIKADACASGIGKSNSEVQLLQLSAQLLCDIIDSGGDCPSGCALVENISYSTPGSDGGNVTWNYSGADPDHWQIMAQLSGGYWVEYFPQASGNLTCAGNLRTIALDGLAIVDTYADWSGIIAVVGKTSPNLNETPSSNSVQTGIV